MAGTHKDLDIGFDLLPPIPEKYEGNYTAWAAQDARDREHLLRGLRHPMMIPNNDTDALMNRFNLGLEKAEARARATGNTRQMPRKLCRLVSVDANTTRTVNAGLSFSSFAYVDAFVKVAGENDECNTWKWKAGDSFTMISFFDPVDVETTAHTVMHMFAHLL